MRDYINIGSVPLDEPCVQVGVDKYRYKATKECERFIKDLKKLFGNPPPKAELAIKEFPHDFGTYLDVVCYYDDEDEESTVYCHLVEADTPERWLSEE